MKKEFYHEFHFGRKETTIWQYAIIGFILERLLTWLVSLGFDKKELMQLIDKINRKAGNQQLNDYIIRDEEWLDARVEGDVDEAIEEVQLTTDWEPVTMAESITIESEPDGSNAQSLLGGELRATYDFILREEDSNGNQDV